MSAFKPLKAKYGRLTVVERIGTDKHRHPIVRAICDCGVSISVQADSIRSGRAKSCGCLQRERVTTHGGSRTKVYKAWLSLLQRCYNEKDKGYQNYGGRGVRVCDRWRNDFALFMQDMGARPAGTSIDRANNDGDYTPENCRWATPTEQNNNTRSNRRITISGTTATIAEWSRSVGINPGTIGDRLLRWWSEQDAVLTPPRRYTQRLMQMPESTRLAAFYHVPKGEPE